VIEREQALQEFRIGQGDWPAVGGGGGGALLLWVEEAAAVVDAGAAGGWPGWVGCAGRVRGWWIWRRWWWGRDSADYFYGNGDGDFGDAAADGDVDADGELTAAR
jgi:hypothetical protein